MSINISGSKNNQMRFTRGVVFNLIITKVEQYYCLASITNFILI